MIQGESLNPLSLIITTVITITATSKLVPNNGLTIKLQLDFTIENRPKQRT